MALRDLLTSVLGTAQKAVPGVTAERSLRDLLAGPTKAVAKKVATDIIPNIRLPYSQGVADFLDRPVSPGTAGFFTRLGDLKQSTTDLANRMTVPVASIDASLTPGQRLKEGALLPFKGAYNAFVPGTISAFSSLLPEGVKPDLGNLKSPGAFTVDVLEKAAGASQFLPPAGVLERAVPKRIPNPSNMFPTPVEVPGGFGPRTMGGVSALDQQSAELIRRTLDDTQPGFRAGTQVEEGVGARPYMQRVSEAPVAPQVRSEVMARSNSPLRPSASTAMDVLSEQPSATNPRGMRRWEGYIQDLTDDGVIGAGEASRLLRGVSKVDPDLLGGTKLRMFPEEQAQLAGVSAKRGGMPFSDPVLGEDLANKELEIMGFTRASRPLGEKRINYIPERTTSAGKPFPGQTASTILHELGHNYEVGLPETVRQGLIAKAERIPVAERTQILLSGGSPADTARYAAENPREFLAEAFANEKLYDTGLLGRKLPPENQVIDGLTPRGGQNPHERFIAANPELVGLRRVGEPTADVSILRRQNTPETRVFDVERVDEPQKPLGLLESIKRSDQASTELKKGVSGTYTPQTNVETVQKAAEYLQKNGAGKTEDFVLNGKELSAERTDAARQLIQYYQETNNIEGAIRVADAYADQLRKAGQATQAARLWQAMAPETLLYKAEKTVKGFQEDVLQGSKKLRDQFKARVDGLINDGVDRVTAERLAARELKLPTLTPEIAKEVTDMAKKIQGMDPASREYEVLVAKTFQKIADMEPVGFLGKAAAYQYTALLLNPKTVVRNILGNTGAAISDALTSPTATLLDKALPGGRTTTLFNPAEYARGAARGAKKTAEDVALGIRTNEAVTDKFILPKRASVFKSGPGKAAEKGVRYSLEVPDAFFREGKLAESLQNQMRAAKVAQPTEAMLKQAMQESLEATFQDKNVVGSLLSGLKQLLNDPMFFFGKTQRQKPIPIGVGSALALFGKTAGSIVNWGIKNSPMGFIRAAAVHMPAIQKVGYQATKRPLVQDLAKAINGTVAYSLLGYHLADLGIVEGKRPGDKDLANLQKATGSGERTINISALQRYVTSGFDAEAAKPKDGDKIREYGWAVPVAIPFELGVNFRKDQGLKVGSVSTQAVENAATAVDQVASQPLLGNVLRFAETAGRDGIGAGVADLARGYGAAFTPTALNQVRQVVDNSARNTATPNFAEDFLNRIKNRVPGVSKTLPQSYDTLGKPKENFEGGTNSFFNVFLNPGRPATKTSTPEQRYILDLYEKTQDPDVLPRTPGRVQEIRQPDGSSVQRELTNEEYSAFTKEVGEQTRKLLADDAKLLQRGYILTSPSNALPWSVLPAADKAKYLSSQYDKIVGAAQKKLLGEVAPSPVDAALKQVRQLQNPIK